MRHLWILTRLGLKCCFGTNIANVIYIGLVITIGLLVAILILLLKKTGNNSKPTNYVANQNNFEISHKKLIFVDSLLRKGIVYIYDK